MTATPRKEDCVEAIAKYLQSPDFELKDYSFKPFNQGTAGFMGQHLRLTADVVFDGKFQQISFFAKLIPTEEKHRSMVLRIFLQEAAFYSDLVPKFNSCLPPGIVVPVPKCFFIRYPQSQDLGNAKEEVIILEDLTCKGYRSLENFPPMDVPHCEAVLRSMAKLHVSSILLEESCRKTHEENFDPKRDLFSEIKEHLLTNDKSHRGNKVIRQSAESLSTAAFKLWPDKLKGLSRENVTETLMKGWTKVIEMAVSSSEYPKVVCHGDPWTNNILFKYERGEAGREVPVDAIFVDLQVTRYALPVFDILIFLHVCTRREFRERHLMDFLKVYHTAFGECAPEHILHKFPFKRLVDMCDKYRDLGRIMCTMYFPIILPENDPVIIAIRKSSESVNIAKTMFSNNGDEIANYCGQSESYRTWISDSFQECLETLNIW
ncbi:uncharacterized protein LOC124158620 isoform X5 [Ischnura elegans]|uniref:uncharacterized protein LOC124158620 isoform X5 n=1 Tax=Ischnura elegans TaxID=197161 RepID=UPI001ED8A9C9|nr:uncharacterized protein LOC124158620 isoform X5 [Ischnura elegans]